jgi:uncharacterized protein (DUF924 family)
MTDTRRRFRVPTEDTSSYIDRRGTFPTSHSSPRRSASAGQNDTLLYAFTVIILIVGLILGYYHMPSATPPGLNKAIFNPRLYSHIQSIWFADVPTGATIASEASLKKWFFNPNADEKAAFDRTCTADFKHALEEVGPKRLRLPPFTNFTAERQMARNLASPLMSEIDISSGELSTETAASNALSLILLLDQLSRNVYRSDQALIYTHYDRLSQAIIHHILASQPRLDLVPKYRNFPVYRNWFYMPLMHSEHIEDHVLSKSLMTSMKEDIAKVGDTAAVEYVEDQVNFEKRHVDIIEQFGRYPYRNKVLGREITEEEKKWMEEGGDHFGTA